MPTITSFIGEKLLEPAVVAEIKNQTEILLKNKDVAGAFRSAGHLKAELAKLPAEKGQAALADYRSVTANLKVLALPLLEKEELKNLLANNLPFVGNAYADIVPASLAAWLALQPEADKEKTKEELLSVLPADNPLAEKVKAVISSASSLPLVVVSPSVIPAAFSPRENGEGIQFSRNSLDSGSMAGMTGGRDKSGLGVATKKDELFDADEASELASHAAKVNEMGGSPLPTDGALTLAGEILKQVQHDGGKVQSPLRTGFGDVENFKRRAQALIVSRLRDVRATAEIRDYLSRPFAVGGLGLSGNGLEQSLKLIEQEYQKLHAAGPGKTAAQDSRPTTSRQPEAGAAPLAEESQIVKSQDEGKAVLSAASEAVAPPADSAGGLHRNDNQKTGVAANIKAGAPLPPAPLPSRLIPRIMRTAADSTSDKPRLDDIKRPSAERPNADIALPFGGKGQVPAGRVSAAQREGNIGSGTVGATDELKLLTLADWRKLGGSPAAINHILEKVAVLDKESLSEKLTAIESFRASSLFREYLDIGRGALSAGRKLSAALADTAVNSNKMTEEEFFAVAELNGKLK